MSNKGFELSLDGDVVRSKTLTWNVNLNMTYFKNKITELDPTIAKDGLKAGSSIIRIGGSRYEDIPSLGEVAEVTPIGQIAKPLGACSCIVLGLPSPR